MPLSTYGGIHFGATHSSRSSASRNGLPEKGANHQLTPDYLPKQAVSEQTMVFGRISFARCTGLLPPYANANSRFAREGCAIRRRFAEEVPG